MTEYGSIEKSLKKDKCPLLGQMFGKVSKALLKLKDKYECQATWSRQFVRMPDRKANKTHCGKRTDTGLNRDQEGGGGTGGVHVASRCLAGLI